MVGKTEVYYLGSQKAAAAQCRYWFRIVKGTAPTIFPAQANDIIYDAAFGTAEEAGALEKGIEAATGIPEAEWNEIMGQSVTSYFEEQNLSLQTEGGRYGKRGLRACALD